MSADLLAAFGIENEPVKNTAHQKSHGTEAGLTDAVSLASFETHLTEHKTKTNVQQSPARQPITTDSNVLFDADDFENVDDDEFGDFEGADVESSKEPVSPFPALNTGLLDLLDDNDGNQPAVSTFKAVEDVLEGEHESEDDWGQFTVAEPDLGPSKSKMGIDPKQTNHLRSSNPNVPQSISTKSSAVEKPEIAQIDEFEVWDDFETDTAPAEDTKDDEALALITITPSERHERPMNVPPPAVILRLLTKAVTLLSSPVESAKDNSIGTNIVCVYRVTGRVISGRSLRWKRDTILAQSMRIGAAGRSGGMKLTAVDKGETRREDQETEELLSTWTTHLYSLNKAMIRAKVRKPPITLSAELVVKTATGSDVLTATHVCPICGLRRNERVNGIDVSVSDTFGDFWIEHWGHTDCHNFWYQFNQHLEQR